MNDTKQELRDKVAELTKKLERDMMKLTDFQMKKSA
tara:strand:+ start:12492 stop:12599 length:108 start_codon:yes stop_codon:yes gene_type:complete